MQKITTSQTKGFNLPAITAITVCIIFALWSGLWFWASALTVRPEAVINQWEQNLANNTEALSLEASAEQHALALKMIDRLKRSIAINPLDARTNFLLARLYELLTITQKKPNYILLAELNYKNAIRKQPTWDLAWARVARVYDKQKKEHLALSALTVGLTLGSYEVESERILIPLIFKYWDSLSDIDLIQSKKIIQYCLKIDHGFTAQFKEMIFKNAVNYGHKEKIKPLLWNQKQLEELINIEISN